MILDNRPDMTAGHIPKEYKGQAGPGWHNSYRPSWTAQSASRAAEQNSQSLKTRGLLEAALTSRGCCICANKFRHIK